MHKARLAGLVHCNEFYVEETILSKEKFKKMCFFIIFAPHAIEFYH